MHYKYRMILFYFRFSLHFKHNLDGAFGVNIQIVMKVLKFSVLDFKTYLSTLRTYRFIQSLNNICVHGLNLV